MLNDLRYALRVLLKNPGFTAVAAFTLALGIGANTTIFSIVNALLIKPLPYHDPERLVMVWDQLLKLGLNQFATTFGNYFDYKDQNRVFDDIAAFHYADFNLTGGDQPERLSGMRVSANLFLLLGVEASQGRTFVADENQPGRDKVALLSNTLWQRRFGAAPNLIGKRITLNDEDYTVVGVMPPDFRLTLGSSSLPEVWLPVVFRPDPGRSSGNLVLVARLKHGVALEQALANMKTLAGRIQQQFHPYTGPNGEDAGYDVTIVPLRQQLFGSLLPALLVLLLAVGFVLLIACANLANLLLSRAEARGKEMTIRTALGASRLRLHLQLLRESTLLAVLGGSFGLVIAYWGIDIVVAFSPDNISPLAKIGIDSRVLGFTWFVSILTGLTFGLAPAMKASKIDLTKSLKERSRSSPGGFQLGQLRHLLVVAEVAISLVLLSGASLMIRSFLHLQNVSLGFTAERLLTGQISLPQAKYFEDHRVVDFYKRLLEHLEMLPGVRSASMVSALPFGGTHLRDPFSIEGRPYDTASKTPQVANFQVIGLTYFRAMQIPVLSGRFFNERDVNGASPVAIINETMARGFWPNEDPIGKRIMMGAPMPERPWLKIVGVVGDVRNSGLETPPLPQMYASYLQNPTRSMTLVISTALAAQTLTTAIERQVNALDKDLPIYDVKSMEQRLSNSVAQPRFRTLLLAIFAVLALVLSAVGIYGVMSYSTQQRTHEIGIRIALGAQTGDVLKLVVRQGMVLTLIGVVIGLALSFALTRFLSSLLFGVSATDPGTFIAVSVLLAIVALVACYIPARRAAKVDPIVALRYE
jgi:putative ABC transport system permease protein